MRSESSPSLLLSRSCNCSQQSNIWKPLQDYPRLTIAKLPLIVSDMLAGSALLLCGFVHGVTIFQLVVAAETTGNILLMSQVFVTCEVGMVRDAQSWARLPMP